FFFSSRRRHTRFSRDWSSDVSLPIYCMKPNGGGAPTGKVADAINAKWGSFDKFKEEFTKSCVGNFGSGWTWLVKKGDGSLDIVRSEERRVGKECRSRWAADPSKADHR